MWPYFALAVVLLGIWIIQKYFIERMAKHRIGAPQVIDLREHTVYALRVPRINTTPLNGLTSDHPVITEGDWTEEQTQRALFALDAIRLGTEGRLGLKNHMISARGVTTVHGDAAYMLSDKKIIRAAKKALTGQVEPKVHR